MKQDRNYQPPRVKPRQTLSDESGQSSQKRPELHRQKSVKSEIANDDYGDDFEAEEEEDENAADQQLIAKKKEAWLYDQAIRGRARQKAGQALHQQTKSKLIGKDSLIFGYLSQETLLFLNKLGGLITYNMKIFHVYQNL